MYYTGKGDQGTSKLFNSKDRIVKSDLVFEVLGSLDELNSWLGLCAVEAKEELEIYQIIRKLQNDLFICQAHFAQSEVVIPSDLLSWTEQTINNIAQKIKPRQSFVLSGGCRLSALLDVGRTLARKSERRAVELGQDSSLDLKPIMFSYLNRLSSLLYVLARWANDLSEEVEQAPDY